MAMLPPSAGLGGGRGRGRYRPLAEINVTPLVDVMLVLLIVFMVAAPLMTSGVTVDLPKTNAAPLGQENEPLTVSLDAQGRLFLQDAELQLPELVTRLRAVSQDKPDRRIFVRGDRGIAYGRVMEVMATITRGGFTKVALLAEQTGEAPAGASGIAPAAAPAAGPGQPAASVPAPSRRQGRG